MSLIGQSHLSKRARPLSAGLLLTMAACSFGNDADQPTASATSGVTAPDVTADEQTIFANETPQNPSDPDTSAVELGLKFRAAKKGFVTGVRFYKSSANRGRHLGHLWSASGQLLSTVTFASETASGWQLARFPSPVAISANTTYVVSYFAPRGRYAGDNGGMTTGRTSRDLTALASGSDGGNGVYRYGASGFPSSSYQATNYWVDVVFKPDGAASGADAGTTTPPPPTTPLPPGAIDPARFGMPDATTAGVPPNTTLKAYTGPMTISTAGTVIENVIINGTLAVTGANVTIRNSVIQNFGKWGIEGEKSTNMRIEHCDFLGGGTGSSAILGGHGVQLIGNDIRGLVIGIQLADGAATVRDNYIHDLADTGPSPHFDGITVLGRQNGVLIEHNTISLPDSQGTAAVFIKTEFGSIDDVTVRNNLMYGNPSYTMYVEDTANGTITNVVIENNYIERGYYGYIYIHDASPIVRNNVQWQAGVDPTPYPL